MLFITISIIIVFSKMLLKLIWQPLTRFVSIWRWQSSHYVKLLSFLQVFTEYFKELEEESIQDNFVVVYELLDELMDFGFPQTTDSKILQEWATLTEKTDSH